MNNEVPDVESETSDSDKTLEKLRQAEARLLLAEAKALEVGNREADQRYTLRWITVIVALALIVVMLCILLHMSHQVFFGPFLMVPSSYAIALVVVPIGSITAIIVALFIASFRGYKNGDEETAASAAKAGVRGTGILN